MFLLVLIIVKVKQSEIGDLVMCFSAFVVMVTRFYDKS